jgi:hypothetical protein
MQLSKPLLDLESVHLKPKVHLPSPQKCAHGAAPREIYLQQFPHVENLPVNLKLSVDWSKKSNLLNF